MAKASAKVVFSFATRNRFWLGMMSSVSTTLCSSAMPCSATRILRMPSKWNGFVITPTVRMPASFAQRATTGAAPVPVPPPIAAVTAAGWGRSAAGRWECPIESSEALAKPSSDPCDIAAPCRRVPRSPRFEMLKMRRLRVDQQPRRDGECRPLRFLRQSGNAERSPEPHRAAQNLRGKLGHAGELARPAGKHHAPARLGCERPSRQAIADHFQYFFHAWLDDAGEALTLHQMRV